MLVDEPAIRADIALAVNDSSIQSEGCPRR